MMIGTCNFATFEDAVLYYKKQQIGEQQVLRKLKSGEIQIGKPRIRKGERLHIDPKEGRYIIEEEV